MSQQATSYNSSQQSDTQIYRHKIEKRTSVLAEAEGIVRDGAQHGTLYLLGWNNIANVAIFLKHLVSLETLLSLFLSVTFTVFSYDQTRGNLLWNGGTMSWVLLSFTVITPMSASLNMAFSRREEALQHLATLRSTFTQLYFAHATWDWPLPGGKSGRAASSVNWLEFSDQLLEEIILVCDDLCRFLTLPTSSRARHTMTQGGSLEAAHLKDLSKRMLQELGTRMDRIALFVEILKREGLPANEGIRMRNWEYVILNEVQNLHKLKMYRTPQALRTISRLMSVFLPPFYAPYYAEIARDISSLSAGIIFAVVAALALTALFESLTQMEDPFVAYITLDGIDVHEELRERLTSQLIGQRENVLFVGEHPFRNKELIQEMSRRGFQAADSARILTAE